MVLGVGVTASASLRRLATLSRHLTMSAADAGVRIERVGSVAHLILDRPKALNALNLPMVRVLSDAYAASAGDAAVTSIVMSGAGGKAFCAGGDVRAVMEAARVDPTGLSDAFFREEYALNAAIAGCPTPQVSVWDGIVMGGGVGLSLHGRFRVATERASFAMPETGIGFFPDVGGSHFLSRLPAEVGTYLALTGARIGAADLVHAGLATHFVPSDAAPGVAAALDGVAGEAAVADALAALGGGAAPPAEGATLAANAGAIERCFAAPTVEAIVGALEAEGGEWAAGALKALRRVSPTSLKLTLRLLRDAGDAPLSECLRREFRASQRAMRPPSDFFEGIRAALVDKDRSPKWEPDALPAVSDAAVASFLANLGDRELELPLLTPAFKPV